MFHQPVKPVLSAEKADNQYKADRLLCQSSSAAATFWLPHVGLVHQQLQYKNF
jgi:hypothetical protein